MSEELHTSYPGIVRMKSLARLLIWRPSIDCQIEAIVSKSSACQSVRSRPLAVTLDPTRKTRPRKCPDLVVSISVELPHNPEFHNGANSLRAVLETPV